MTDKIPPIVHYVNPTTINVRIVDEHDKPVDGFKGELWINYGGKFFQNMPGGECSWMISSTNTLFWVFIDGEYRVDSRNYVVRVSHAFPGIEKDQSLIFVLRDWSKIPGDHILIEATTSQVESKCE